jgi:hypothetical protein
MRGVRLASLVALALALPACRPGPAVPTARHDIDDVTGGESTAEGRETDRLGDASEQGVRIREDGTIEVGGTAPAGAPPPR